MNKNHKIELNKFEFMVLMFSRAIQKGIKTFLKSTFVKILLLILILSFILICASAIGKSFNYISKGDILYKNIEYELSLENYELANQWWIFEHISPKLQNNSLLIKIRKAQIMVKSTDYYNQGKKDFEEGRYTNAKLNFGYMAENDPRNSEVEDILLEIDEIKAITKLDEVETIVPISSPNKPTPPVLAPEPEPVLNEPTVPVLAPEPEPVLNEPTVPVLAPEPEPVLNEPTVPVLTPEPEPVLIIYLNLNEPYISKNDMTVTVTNIKKIEETGSYKYIISYKQENKTTNKELNEGWFIMFFEDNTNLGQSGFFGSLFPNESIERTYTFQTLKTQKPFYIEFEDNWEGFKDHTLKWIVD